MSATATPTKRRALGALDVNVTRSPRSPSGASSAKLMTTGARGGSSTNSSGSNSPVKKQQQLSSVKKTTQPLAAPAFNVVSSSSSPNKKRRSPALEGAEEGLGEPAVKKVCSGESVQTVLLGSATVGGRDRDEDDRRASQNRSISPDASSLFDSSSAVINTSQLTNLTEPDAPTTFVNDNNAHPLVQASHGEAAAVTAATNTISAAALAQPAAQAGVFGSSGVPALRVTRRTPPTREECRQRAEILRLRLSLATYKLKTNQADVPLDELQVRPVPGMAPRAGNGVPLPSMQAHTVQRATPAQYWYRSSRGSQGVAGGPAAARTGHVASFAVGESVVGETGTARAASVLDEVVSMDGEENDEEEEEEEGDDEEVEVEIGRGHDDEEMDEDDEDENDDDDEADAPVLPVLSTPRKGSGGPAEDEVERLTSSGLRGGAAKGLLSLSQG